MPTIRKGTRLARLPTLRTVLAKWISTIDLLASQWIPYSEDVPWWYNERASLSVFAGAVWRSYGWAFEEFAVAKQIGRSTAKRSERTGRCDINFAVGGHEYVAEAKQAWPNIDAPGSTPHVVEEALAGALRDARAITYWGLPTLAMVFVSPRLLATNSAHMKRHCAEFVSDLLAIQNATVAWTFPPMAREMRPEGRNRHRIYPGAAVVLVRAA